MPPEIEKKPVRRRLNASQKRALKVAEVARFIHKYGSINRWPNDRGLSTSKLKHKLRQISPEKLDKLMREDED